MKLVTFRKDWKKIKDKYAIGFINPTSVQKTIVKFLDYNKERSEVTYLKVAEEVEGVSEIIKEMPFCVFESLEAAQTFLESNGKV